MKRLLIISLLLAGTLSGAQSLRKEAGDCFLEPLEARRNVGFRMVKVIQLQKVYLQEVAWLRKARKIENANARHTVGAEKKFSRFGTLVNKLVATFAEQGHTAAHTDIVELTRKALVFFCHL